MFKLIVVCAFFAAAAAKPGALLYQAPITHYSTIVEPATTTIVKQDSTVVHPSPLHYYSPLAYTHYIHKRSAPWAAPTYPVVIAPVYKTALYQNPHILPTYPVPITSNVHYIKKRSAPLVPTTYIAPSAYSPAIAPLLTTSYTATAPLIPSTHYIPSTPYYAQPLAYTHFIKK